MLDITTSLKHIMRMCHDFCNEEGMLQHIAICLGAKVMLTPKGHAELAGLTALAGVSGCSPNKARVVPCANTPEPKCLDINSNEV